MSDYGCCTPVGQFVGRYGAGVVRFDDAVGGVCYGGLPIGLRCSASGELLPVGLADDDDASLGIIRITDYKGHVLRPCHTDVRNPAGKDFKREIFLVREDQFTQYPGSAILSELDALPAGYLRGYEAERRIGYLRNFTLDGFGGLGDFGGVQPDFAVRGESVAANDEYLPRFGRLVGTLLRQFDTGDGTGNSLLVIVASAVE